MIRLLPRGRHRRSILLLDPPPVHRSAQPRCKVIDCGNRASRVVVRANGRPLTCCSECADELTDRGLATPLPVSGPLSGVPVRWSHGHDA